MPRAYKNSVFVSREHARLGELIALLDGSNEIAPIESDVFRRKAGELISRAASGLLRPIARTRSPRKKPSRGARAFDRGRGKSGF